MADTYLVDISDLDPIVQSLNILQARITKLEAALEEFTKEDD